MAIDATLCHLCLKSSEFLLDIFEEQNENKNLATIISQHFWLDIKREENVSKNVCVVCWSKVDDFHTFYTHVYNIHNEFFSRVHEEIKIEIDETPEEVKPAIKSERQISVENPIHFEVDKCETLLEENNDENSNDSFQEPAGFDDNDASSSSDSDASVAKPKVKSVRKKKRKPREIDPIVKAKLAEENVQIRERFPMECEICNFIFETFNDAQVHYRKEHQKKGYLKCCDTKFKTRPTVMEHVRRHLSPDEFKCGQCNKHFVSKRGLSEHMDRHLATEDKPFKCPKCPKSYVRNFLLERHMESHKDLPKCVCGDCGKEYSNKISLNMHKKNYHERANIHICDVCAKEFRNKVDFDQHHRNVHENVVQPKVQCKVCSSWLKTKQYLRQHMVRYHDIQVMLSCAECEKSFPYRRALLIHMRTVHPKKLFDCHMCDKQFKTRVSLKEHLATHSGVSLYTCPHCPKTFNSKANMYSHRKKMHKTEREAHLKLKAAGLV